MPGNTHHGAQRIMLGQLDGIHHVQIGEDLIEVSVDVPRVVFLRCVHECLQQVAAAAGGDGVEVGLLVHQAGDAAGFGVDHHAQELVLQRVSVRAGLHTRGCCGLGSACRPDVEQLIAQGRNIGRQRPHAEGVGLSTSGELSASRTLPAASTTSIAEAAAGICTVKSTRSVRSQASGLATSTGTPLLPLCVSM